MSLLKFGVMLAMYSQLQSAPPVDTLFDTPHLPPVRETGLASWYGNGTLHGAITANGEPFNPYDFTCAHRALPFDAVVLLVNTANDRRAWCRINDRGPYGRIGQDGTWGIEVSSDESIPYRGILDMSIAIADQLDTREQGLQHIEIRYWRPLKRHRTRDLSMWSDPSSK